MPFDLFLFIFAGRREIKIELEEMGRRRILKGNLHLKQYLIFSFLLNNIFVVAN